MNVPYILTSSNGQHYHDRYHFLPSLHLSSADTLHGNLPLFLGKISPGISGDIFLRERWFDVGGGGVWIKNSGKWFDKKIIMLDQPVL
jgi:hypothetical protein